MEPLFWILFIGGGCFLGGAIIAGVISGISNAKKTGDYAKKYIACGIISKDQKEQLPAILLQKGQEALASGHVSEAISYLNDCLELGKLNDSIEKKDDATFTLAECYVANGNDAKALKLLSYIFTSQAYLLRAELLLKRNQGYDFDEAARCAKTAMEDEALKDRAQAILQKTQVIANEKREQKARERFESAIKKCSSLDLNPSVTRVRYISPGNHFKTLGYYLNLYNDITGYADAEQRKNYSNQLSLIVFQIASMCCAFGFQASAYAYLQKEDHVTLPQKDFVYAMIYARYGLDGLYESGIKYSQDVIEEYRKKMDTETLPMIDYDKALEYAQSAQQNGVREAGELIRKIEFIREYRRKQQEHQEMLDRIQNLWDREFEKKHGMSRDEYDEYTEEHREAERERQEREADEAAKRAAREQRLQRDMDYSEMLQDKLAGGSGRTMEEKWKLGEISADQYMDYKNKREQEIDTLK